ncbi:MAG: hypothetical protein AB7T31_15310 [Gemmatimonadales bacterium]
MTYRVVEIAQKTMVASVAFWPPDGMRYRNVVFAIVFVACAGQDTNEALEVDACVERGIAYFKEIGSYPTLTSSAYEGRNADEEARARCERTTTAF